MTRSLPSVVLYLDKLIRTAALPWILRTQNCSLHVMQCFFLFMGKQLEKSINDGRKRSQRPHGNP